MTKTNFLIYNWWLCRRRRRISNTKIRLLKKYQSMNPNSNVQIQHRTKKLKYHKNFKMSKEMFQIFPNCSVTKSSLTSMPFVTLSLLSLTIFCSVIETTTTTSSLNSSIQNSHDLYLNSPSSRNLTTTKTTTSSNSLVLIEAVSNLTKLPPHYLVPSWNDSTPNAYHTHQHHGHAHHHNQHYRNDQNIHHSHHKHRTGGHLHHKPHHFSQHKQLESENDQDYQTSTNKDLELDLRPYQPFQYQNYLHQTLSAYSNSNDDDDQHVYQQRSSGGMNNHQQSLSSSSLPLLNQISSVDSGQPIDQLQILPIENVTVSVGRNAILKCIINRPGHFNVAWLKMDANLGPTLLTLGVNSLVTEEEGKYKVTHNERQWLLHVNRVQVQDRGRYMCQMNSKSMTSPSISTGYLDVHEPPVIIEELTSSDTTVDELQKVSLKCATAGYPSPTVSWRRENGKSLNLGLYGGKKFAAHKWDGEHLNITQVTREDMGAYLCIASNGVPPSVSKRIVLQVNFRPKIRVHNQLVSAYLGSDVELECRVESSPRPQTVWLTSTGQKLEELTDLSVDDDLYRHSAEQFYNGPGSTMPKAEHNSYIRTSVNGQSRLMQNHFHSKRKKFQIDEDNDGYRTIMRLTIRRLDSNDFGPYKCVAKNSLGEKEGLVRLYEIPVPTLPPTTSTTTTTTAPPPPPMPNIIQTSAIGSGMMVNGRWKAKSNNGGGVQIDYSKESSNGDSLNSGRSLRENQNKNSDYDDDDDDDNEKGELNGIDDDITFLEQLYKDKIKIRKSSSSSSSSAFSFALCRNHFIFTILLLSLLQIIHNIIIK